MPYVTQCLQGTTGPIVATTDYMRIFAEQIRAFMPKGRTYKVLGTDGFGRSDSRAKLREFFEVNRYYVDGRRAEVAGGRRRDLGLGGGRRRSPSTASIRTSRIR